MLDTQDKNPACLCVYSDFEISNVAEARLNIAGELGERLSLPARQLAKNLVALPGTHGSWLDLHSSLPSAFWYTLSI